MKSSILFLLFACFAFFSVQAQKNPIDSCGIDNKDSLNSHEIKLIKDVFFASSNPKKTNINSPADYDFTNKKIAFYSCTLATNSNDTGLLSKNEFFSYFKPEFKGHAGKGLIIFTEDEKLISKGYDAVIVIDCPMINVSNQELIQQLLTLQKQ